MLKWVWSWEAVDVLLVFGVIVGLLRLRQGAVRRKRIAREERASQLRMG